MWQTDARQHLYLETKTTLFLTLKPLEMIQRFD